MTVYCHVFRNNLITLLPRYTSIPKIGLAKTGIIFYCVEALNFSHPPVSCDFIDRVKVFCFVKQRIYRWDLILVDLAVRHATRFDLLW